MNRPPPINLLVTAAERAKRDGESFSLHYEGGKWRIEPGLPDRYVPAWYMVHVDGYRQLVTRPGRTGRIENGRLALLTVGCSGGE